MKIKNITRVIALAVTSAGIVNQSFSFRDEDLEIFGSRVFICGINAGKSPTLKAIKEFLTKHNPDKKETALIIGKHENSFLTMKTIVRLLSSKDFTKCFTIVGLDLSGWQECDPEVIGEFSEALATNTTLAILDLSRRNIDLNSLDFLASALCANSTLKTLILNNNNIGDEGAEYIYEILKENSSLTEIDLSWIPISNKGAKRISEALGANSALETLILHACFIANEGATHIGESLKTNTSLTKIDLSRNRITKKGAKCISEALGSNSALKTLILHACLIAAKDAKTIGKSLGTSTSLTKIDLGGSHIGNKRQIQLSIATPL